MTILDRSRPACAAALLLCIAVACDEKKEATTSASPSASATAPTLPSATAEATATATAAPSAAASAATSTKDPAVSVLDPKSAPQKSIKAQAGGTVTLYLPQWPGTSWSVKESAKPLGKAKQETLPGFAGPGTPGASFVWSLKDPSLKPGQSLKVSLENKSSTDKTAAPTPFSLTIEIVGG